MLSGKKNVTKPFFCRVLLLDTAGAPAQRGDGLKTPCDHPLLQRRRKPDRVVERLHAAAPDVDYLIVNDCSTDGSAALCRARGYNYISLPVNLGIGGGVCRAATYTPGSTAMTSPCRWTATASTTRCFWRTWCGPWPRAGWTCHRQPFYHEGGLSDELHAPAGHQLHQRDDPSSVRRAHTGHHQRLPRLQQGTDRLFC